MFGGVRVNANDEYDTARHDTTRRARTLHDTGRVSPCTRQSRDLMAKLFEAATLKQ